MKAISLCIFLAIGIFSSCMPEKGEADTEETQSSAKQTRAALRADLPVIGLLMYDGVLTTEVTAPLDVFTKHTEGGEQLFNVVTISQSADPIVSEEGLTMLADYTFDNAPELDVLFVPSAYDMHAQVHNEQIVDFIRSQNQHTDYTVSNCAGAHLIGESGIADGKKIVTWIGGGKELQKNYPNLLVQDDSLVSYVEDGKFLSSNGNLATYISSLELLEKLTDKDHRKFVESYLYLDRLQNWEK
ncbi:DJ-1/PfpI family protein [Catalinimonas niigatensis]|uniref:DJ-1/PfpI family protein n=1 Tax=Catalinimonas niigatensis TaxID=1397264 RepID=UPI002666EFAB|nr:DJ-1/PfpI family protein [Catalinimonas niigatensis]WPP52438.1 DJ-1/PfpI family protein [Catalinimonas niigatensis]